MMPMGHKALHGHASITDIDGAHGYRVISEIMSADGDQMNHATARHVFIRAMEKMARKVATSMSGKPTEDNIQRIAKDPRFQEAVMAYLRKEDF